MRVLFANFPLQPHLLFMVPLAWALRSAGHTVQVAGHPESAPHAAAAGLPFVPVGEPYRGWELMRRKEASGTAGRDRFVIKREYVEGEHTRELLLNLVEGQVKSADVIHGPTITDLTAFCRSWRPDLVLWDPMFPAAPIAAEAAGAAHARLLPGQDYYGWLRNRFLDVHRAEGRRSPGGTDVPEQDDDPLGHWLGTWASRYGVPFSETLSLGHFTVDLLPDWARLQGGPEPLSMRYVPHSGRAVLPRRFRERPRGPRVCLVLSTTAARQSLFPSATFEELQEILDVLADLPVEIVVAGAGPWRGSVDPPDNAVLVDFVPLHELLPTCSAVIHTGGFNAFGSALHEGVPQLPLRPWMQFDSLLRAERLADQGAGIVSAPESPAASVRRGLIRLLDEPGFQEEARRLSEETRTRPLPAEMVPVFEELALRHRAT
ncbi:nucleotide disphospho-sugar-binding domain-containing protein [Nocardiopsis alba]|uniref:nucleotide disphospho-sugar-binding domain-containing protein n=1 Tax=Nocardiopsis alba TaxID=53437 RepID=UPI00366EDB11